MCRRTVNQEQEVFFRICNWTSSWQYSKHRWNKRLLINLRKRVYYNQHVRTRIGTLLLLIEYRNFSGRALKLYTNFTFYSASGGLYPETLYLSFAPWPHRETAILQNTQARHSFEKFLDSLDSTPVNSLHCKMLGSPTVWSGISCYALVQCI